MRDGAQIRWTLDERVSDGFYSATGLALIHRIVEDPQRYIGAAA